MSYVLYIINAVYSINIFPVISNYVIGSLYCIGFILNSKVIPSLLQITYMVNISLDVQIKKRQFAQNQVNIYINWLCLLSSKSVWYIELLLSLQRLNTKKLIKAIPNWCWFKTQPFFLYTAKFCSSCNSQYCK